MVKYDELGYRLLVKSSDDPVTDIAKNRLKAIGVSENEISDYKDGVVELEDGLDRLPDVIDAAKFLAKAIKNKKKILCVTDYDADGITSAVTLYKSLSEVFKVPSEKLDVIVNKRKYGNGINRTLVDQIISIPDVDVILLADHGSSDEMAYKDIKFHLPDVTIIVTDHHQVPYDNPKVPYPHTADYFVNAQRIENQYESSISGCMTAFLLMYQLYKEMYGKYDLEAFGDIVVYPAISTITDVMSMASLLNRYIVRVGLRILNSDANETMASILTSLGLTNEVIYKDIGYKIGPLLNTGNRTNHEELVYDMLSTDDHDLFCKNLMSLLDLSAIRKEHMTKVMQGVISQLGNRQNPWTNILIIDTNLAINGVVAGNVLAYRRRPTIVFTDNQTSPTLVGSGRCDIEGFNFLEVLNTIEREHPGILVKYGGHHLAAGVEIIRGKLELFDDLFTLYSKNQLENINLTPIRDIDVEITQDQLTADLAEGILEYAPYGLNWEQPLLTTRLKLVSYFPYSTVTRFQFTKDNESTVDGVYFKVGATSLGDLSNYVGKDVYVVYYLNLDTYQGKVSMTLEIEDLLPIEE